jgi:hypothetical protein
MGGFCGEGRCDETARKQSGNDNNDGVQGWGFCFYLGGNV